MLVLVGLGNPGSKYANNRHNIGFMAVDAIADHLGFGETKSKFQAHMREGMLDNGKNRCKAIALKPQTYMNESGKSVGEVLRFYKLDPSQIIIFHDELDIAPGKLRIKQGGGHAGHNGLRSTDAHIGNSFYKVRLGIGHPGSKAAVTNYVLGDFAKSERDDLTDWMDAIARAAPQLADYQENGLPRFQSEVANLLNPNHHSDRSEKKDKKKKGTPSLQSSAAKSAQSDASNTKDQDQNKTTPTPSNPFAEVLKKVLPPKS